MISRIHRITFLLILASAFTFLVFALLPYGSRIIEALYFNGIYKGLRALWAVTFTNSPVPIIYPVVLVLLAVLALSAFRIFYKKKYRPRTIEVVMNRTIQLLCIIYLLFYWLWGFNYKRPDHLDSLEYLEMISKDSLFAELNMVTDSLILLRSQLMGDLGTFEYNELVELNMRRDLEKVFEATNVAYAGPVRVRLLYPKGSLLRWSTAGIYLPFVSEGHIDPGLHGITWPFTISHEMSHGYGITGEDACNFWAFLACINSPIIRHRYSGYFGYWRYLLSNARLSNAQRFDQYWSGVPEVLKSDLSDVYSYSNRYPDFLPKLRDLIYDNYLKSHGIHEGLQNYSRIIQLVYAWRNTHGSLYLSKEGDAEGE